MYVTSKTDTYALIGRILLSIIFIISACAKMFEWNSTVQMLQMVGIPAAPVMLSIATAIELIGGLAVLLGIFSRVAGLILFLYLIPVTLIMHNFWSVGSIQMSIQLVNFLKNLSIMGGLALLAGYGPGRFSVGSEKHLYEERLPKPRGEAVSSGRI